MWDFLLVTLARLVVFATRPIFARLERRALRKLRQQTVELPPRPIAEVAPNVRVKIDGIVEPAAHSRAFFVRDQAGDRALIQPAAAAAIWCLRDGDQCTLGAGDRVAVIGVARAVDLRLDREVGAHTPADGRTARLVFAGSELHPLYVTRLVPAA